MKAVKVIEPEGSDHPGTEHEIPEADLQWFLNNGWTRAEDKPKKNK